MTYHVEGVRASFALLAVDCSVVTVIVEVYEHRWEMSGLLNISAYQDE